MSLRQSLLWGYATIAISLMGLGANAAPVPKWMKVNLRNYFQQGATQP